MNNAINELVKISKYAGERVDYTQGGGGNTSVKSDDGSMVIKASGFKLKEITQEKGYVPVDYVKFYNFISNVDLNDGKDYETINKQVTADCIIKKDGVEMPRPSVEVGFHSVLKKYVIHTHSIYAGLIVCDKDGEKIAEKLFQNADFGYLFMPYVDPGFTLSVNFDLAIKDYEKKNGKFPEVIFMKNHGLVVSSDDIDRVIAINEKVNGVIAEYFDIKEDLSKTLIKKIDENKFESATSFVVNNLSKFDLKYLDTYPLYPDQLVYLNNLIKFNKEKICIENGKLIYNTNEKEANLLEETLFAFMFIVLTLKNKGDDISVMNDKDVDFINNWEAEKYRRKMAN